MVAAGEQGVVVTLLCDSGERYASTCFDRRWRNALGRVAPAVTDQLMRYLPICGGGGDGAEPRG